MTAPIRSLQRDGWSGQAIREITCAQWFMWFVENAPEAQEHASDGGVILGGVGSIREAVLIQKAKKKKREEAERARGNATR